MNLVSYAFFFSLVWLLLRRHLNFFVQQFYSHGYDFRIANAIFGQFVMRKCSCDGKNIPKEFRFDCFECVYVVFSLWIIIFFLCLSFWFAFYCYFLCALNFLWSNALNIQCNQTKLIQNVQSQTFFSPIVLSALDIFSYSFAKLVSGLFPPFNWSRRIKHLEEMRKKEREHKMICVIFHWKWILYGLFFPIIIVCLMLPVRLWIGQKRRGTRAHTHSLRYIILKCVRLFVQHTRPFIGQRLF